MSPRRQNTSPNMRVPTGSSGQLRGSIPQHGFAFVKLALLHGDRCRQQIGVARVAWTAERSARQASVRGPPCAVPWPTGTTRSPRPGCWPGQRLQRRNGLIRLAPAALAACAVSHSTMGRPRRRAARQQPRGRRQRRRRAARAAAAPVPPGTARAAGPGVDCQKPVPRPHSAPPAAQSSIPAAACLQRGCENPEALQALRLQVSPAVRHAARFLSSIAGEEAASCCLCIVQPSDTGATRHDPARAANAKKNVDTASAIKSSSLRDQRVATPMAHPGDINSIVIPAHLRGLHTSVTRVPCTRAFVALRNRRCKAWGRSAVIQRVEQSKTASQDRTQVINGSGTAGAQRHVK